MAELHRLQSCRRCRHLFVASPGERLCPDCRREARRDRARRALFSGGVHASSWTAFSIFAVGSIGLSVVAGLTHPSWMGLAGWIGAIAALVYIGRTP